MNAKRWWCVFVGGLVLSLSAYCYSPSGAASKTLTDTELQTIWGGAPALYCDVNHTPACHGVSVLCSDVGAGVNEGDDCIIPNSTTYYSPETCGNGGMGEECTNPETLSIQCTAATTCKTKFVNGQPTCYEASSVKTYITTSTDKTKCRNVFLKKRP